MVANSPGQLLENNYFVLNLNESSKIEDASWINPGKVIREVTLTTQGGIACVDFAAKHNLQYVEFDAGWYGHEYENSSDATTITVDPKRSPGPLDLHEVIRYARAQDIGILLYVNQRALTRQLDDILPRDGLAFKEPSLDGWFLVCCGKFLDNLGHFDHITGSVDHCGLTFKQVRGIGFEGAVKHPVIHYIERSFLIAQALFELGGLRHIHACIVREDHIQSTRYALVQLCGNRLLFRSDIFAVRFHVIQPFLFGDCLEGNPQAGSHG